MVESLSFMVNTGFCPSSVVQGLGSSDLGFRL